MQIQFDPNLVAQEDKVLRLFKPTGQLVFQQTLPLWNDLLSIDVSGIAPGLLILQISGRQYQFTTKIVKE